MAGWTDAITQAANYLRRNLDQLPPELPRELREALAALRLALQAIDLPPTCTCCDKGAGNLVDGLPLCDECRAVLEEPGEE